MQIGEHTPWGAAEEVTAYGPEVAFVSTSRHGGLHVTGAAADAIPESVWATVYGGRGWAEEDCEMSIVLVLLIDAGHITKPPETLADTDEIREHARMVVKHYPRYAGINVEQVVPTVPYYVNEYQTDKVIGGGEEGGWYYDTGRFVKCHGVHLDREAAVAQRATLVGMVDDKNEGLHEPGSVLSEGEWAALYIEEAPGADFPSERPRYE